MTSANSSVWPMYVCWLKQEITTAHKRCDYLELHLTYVPEHSVHTCADTDIDCIHSSDSAAPLNKYTDTNTLPFGFG